MGQNAKYGAFVLWLLLFTVMRDRCGLHKEARCQYGALGNIQELSCLWMLSMGQSKTNKQKKNILRNVEEKVAAIAEALGYK